MVRVSSQQNSDLVRVNCQIVMGVVPGWWKNRCDVKSQSASEIATKIASKSAGWREEIATEIANDSNRYDFKALAGWIYWGSDFCPVRLLGGIVLALWGCQTPARYWIKIVHPWVQKFHPALGLGSGEGFLWHFRTPVLFWINFGLRFIGNEQISPKFSSIKTFSRWLRWARRSRDGLTQIAGHPGHSLSKTGGETANGGAKRIVRFWGEKTYHKVSSKASFGGLRKWDWSGLRPFPLRKMTLREQTGGENVS